MKAILSLFLIIFFAIQSEAQIDAKLLRYPDVSQDHICFVYGGDIWLMPKSGGTAFQLTNSPGEESYPKFSPDGQEISFSASYRGNVDVYTISIKGGLPKRLTYASFYDRNLDWHPNGKELIFASRRMMGQRSTNHIFQISDNGGNPKKLPIPYGELASFSPKGDKLVYITKITENYPFKRYRGGLSSDIIVYDFISNNFERLTDSEAIDGKPSWSGDKIYFLSDRAENMRLNVWSHDLKTGDQKQITNFDDFDISAMSAGPSDLVFEAGGDLYLMNLSTEEYSKIDVTIISDLMAEMPRTENLSRSIRNVSASPGGKRVAIEARGEIFNAPAKEGYTLNLTNSSGAFDRDPAWSPDGKYIAYWSDKNGENEIYLHQINSSDKDRQLTKRNGGYGYGLHWSPDSKKIAFIDEKNQLSLVDIETGDETLVEKFLWNVGHGGRNYYTLDWSPNSKWISYSRGIENANNAIFVYDLENKKVHQLTSGFFSEFDPVFSKDGKYLFYLSDREFRANYSDMDNTWIYPNSTQIAMMPLQKEVKSLMPIKNDEVEIKEEDDKKDTEGEEEAEEETKEEEKEKSEGEMEEEAEEKDSFRIDFEMIESRVRILPPAAGNMGNLMTFDGKLVYTRYPNTGSANGDSKLILFDFKEKEENVIIENIYGAEPTADEKMIIVNVRGDNAIIQAAPGQKIKDKVPTDGLSMELVPREEWRQLFNDAWRRHRDFFYDPDMHGVDWDEMRNRYGALIEDARNRMDVNFIISNLVSELSAGHTYTFGGDMEESVPRENTGYLGIDWGVKDGKYFIERIVKPADWETEVRSPLDEPGLDVAAGDYILNVNGIPLTTDKEAYAAFSGLSGHTVSLKINKSDQTDEPVEVLVKCLSQGEEAQLRYLEWIENNRKMVNDLSDGKLGYVYMSNTSSRGQLELVRMYYGQLDRDGFIIDERFNGGGQLADRFLELIKRPVVYNLHWRHGKDHTQPVKANPGPVGMLINGWAGSGGDGLPWAFQELEAGPIVGERTLGILVGPATGHQLIDGGGITVPGARLYDNDGHWFWEGEGVRPDIKVWDDPNILAQGRDPQIERLVEELMREVNKGIQKLTPVPPAENRTAKGLSGKRD